MKDKTFELAFSRMFVYNVLFEDSEVDGRYLRVDERSSVLSISAAGCGVAGLLRFHPRAVDAVDINHHHLALAALKMAAARHVKHHGTFYDLFGRGLHPDAARALRPALEHLPGWVQRYWARHIHRFSGVSLYGTGLTARMLSLLRQRSGLDARFVRDLASRTPAERRAAVDAALAPILRQPAVKLGLESPLQLLALGVNYAQRDRMLDGDGVGDVGTFILRHLHRLCETDVWTNWYVWLAVAGHFNHDDESAVMPYLRKDAHAASTSAPTHARFHHASLFDVLGAAKPATWSHYTLCDAVDWMPTPVQARLFDEIARTARPGARVLMRSVETEDVVARIDGGRRFRRLDAESDAATRDDRSKQYKRVDFYEVAA